MTEEGAPRVEVAPKSEGKTFKVLPDDVQPFIAVKNVLDAHAPPATLYHYTGISGLVGILEEHALRLSHVSFLNDRSELTYAKGVIAAVLGEWRRDDTRIVAGLDQLDQMLPGMFEGLDVFVSCFCEHGDLLSQWRGYSKGAGTYALGFSSSALRSPDTEAEAFALYPIIYDVDEQARIVRDAVSRGLRRHLLSMEGPRTTEGELFTPIGLLMFALSVAGIMFKHSSFGAEREWRLILVRRAEDDMPPVMFRTDQPWYPSPYARATFETGTLPLTDVRCGPSPEPGLASRAVEMLLKSQGYKAAAVTESEIPLRW